MSSQNSQYNICLNEPILDIIGGKAYLITKNLKTFRHHKKLIGQLVKKDGLISLFKQEKEKDRFHKLDSWGINYELFQLVTGTINIKTENGIYRISKELAQIWHRVYHFKQKGFEVQCFVPVNKFTFTDNNNLEDEKDTY